MQSERFNMLKSASRMLLMKKHLHVSGNTFLTCWNVTTAQIILKDKDGIDALCRQTVLQNRYRCRDQDISNKFWK